MNTLSSFASRLAICSWSLQPTGPRDLADQLRVLGISRLQLDLDPLRESPARWGEFPSICDDQGLTMVSGMFRTVGEDYSSLESIRRTGGLVPDATWDANWRNLQVTVEIAEQLGLEIIMTHAGFLPHDPVDPLFDSMIGRMRQVSGICADHGLTLCCETGQESAAALIEFLEHLDEPNVAVNFDPANMLLYGHDDPVGALRTIGGRVKSCHLKDAVAPVIPGVWGEEVPIGCGQVDWSAFFTTLAELDYGGHLCFEREAGDQRLTDLADGIAFVNQLLSS